MCNLLLPHSLCYVFQAWDQIVPLLTKAMRACSPTVAAHPDWKMACTLDGFGSHVSTLAGVTGFRKAGIELVKEESQSSHVVQPFDRDVALNDKKMQRRLLDLVRDTGVLGTIIDQHGLVLVGLQVVRESKPEHWISSFIKCNLHPKFRIPLDDWLINFLEAGSKFEAAPTQTVEEQLPKWYGEMDEEKQKQMHEVFRGAGMNWDYGVVKKLAELGLNAKQMGQAGQCHLAVERTKAAAATDCEIASASEEGGSVRLWPTQTPAALADGSETAAAALQTEEVSLPPAPQVFDPKRGLHAFTLKPAGLKGKELFAHMCRMRKRYSPDHISLRVRRLNSKSRALQALNLEIGVDQLGLVEGDMADRALGELLKAASGNKKLRMPKRTLNVIGEDKASCQLITSDEYVQKMRSVAQLADGIHDYKEKQAEVKEQKAADAGAKQAQKQAELDKQSGVRQLIRPVLAALEPAIPVLDTKKLTKKVLVQYCNAVEPPIKVIGSKTVAASPAADVIAHFVALHPAPAP